MGRAETPEPWGGPFPPVELPPVPYWTLRNSGLKETDSKTQVHPKTQIDPKSHEDPPFPLPLCAPQGLASHLPVRAGRPPATVCFPIFPPPSSQEGTQPSCPLGLSSRSELHVVSAP